MLCLRLHGSSNACHSLRSLQEEPKPSSDRLALAVHSPEVLEELEWKEETVMNRMRKMRTDQVRRCWFLFLHSAD